MSISCCLSPVSSRWVANANVVSGGISSPNQSSVSPAPTPCRHTLGMWGTACSPPNQSGCSLHFLMKGLSGSTPAPGQFLTTPLCWCKGPPTSPPGVIRGPDTGVINNNNNNNKCFIDNREVSTILCVIQIITGLD